MKRLVYLVTLVCILSACSGTQPPPSETEASQSTTAIPMFTRTAPPPTPDSRITSPPALTPSTMPKVQEPTSGEPLIAFQCSQSVGGWPMYYLVVSKLDGSESRSYLKDTEQKEDFYRVVWSPDGSRILVQAYPEIFILDPYDPDQIVTVEEWGQDPEWSLDSQSIVFEPMNPDYGRGLAVANLAGEIVRTYDISRAITDGSISFPRLSPDGRKIAFVLAGGAENVPNLWLLDTGTDETVRLTDMPVEASRDGRSQPVWMSDGQRILWPVSLKTGGRSLLLVSTDGRVLMNVPGVYRPTPSPDGTRFGYWSGTGELYSGGTWVAAADGSGAVKVCDEPLHASWTPDSTKLVGVREGQIRVVGAEQRVEEAYDLRVDESVCEHIVDSPVVYPVVQPTDFWTQAAPPAVRKAVDLPHDSLPSGPLVAFVCGREDMESRLTVTSLGTGEYQHLLAGTTLRQPSWSPDGSALLTEGDGRSIFVTDVRDPQAQTKVLYGRHAQWSPDGKYVVYLAQGDFTHEVVALAGRDDETEYTYSIERLPLSGLSHPVMSPDGRKIAFIWHEVDYSQGIRGRWVTSLKVLETSAGEVRQLTDSTPGEGLDSAPLWLPDSERIVWTYNAADQSNHRLVIVSLKGDILLDVPGRFPSLTPDGTKLTYVGQLGENYYGSVVMEVDGSDADVVAGGWPLVDATWTPDGKGILYTEEGGIAIKGVNGGGDVFIEISYCDSAGHPVMQP